MTMENGDTQNERIIFISYVNIAREGETTCSYVYLRMFQIGKQKSANSVTLNALLEKPSYWTGRHCQEAMNYVRIDTYNKDCIFTVYVCMSVCLSVCLSVCMYVCSSHASHHPRRLSPARRTFGQMPPRSAESAVAFSRPCPEAKPKRQPTPASFWHQQPDTNQTLPRDPKGDHSLIFIVR